MKLHSLEASEEQYTSKSKKLKRPLKSCIVRETAVKTRLKHIRQTFQEPTQKLKMNRQLITERLPDWSL